MVASATGSRRTVIAGWQYTGRLMVTKTWKVWSNAQGIKETDGGADETEEDLKRKQLARRRRRRWNGNVAIPRGMRCQSNHS